MFDPPIRILNLKLYSVSWIDRVNVLTHFGEVFVYFPRGHKHKGEPDQLPTLPLCRQFHIVCLLQVLHCLYAADI